MSEEIFYSSIVLGMLWFTFCMYKAIPEVELEPCAVQNFIKINESISALISWSFFGVVGLFTIVFLGSLLAAI